jgi:hypothetical protein
MPDEGRGNSLCSGLVIAVRPDGNSAGTKTLKKAVCQARRACWMPDEALVIAASWLAWLGVLPCGGSAQADWLASLSP